ncbi:MAG: LysR family transcriptional regulator [Saprospiraceae bacterium]
MSNQIELRHLQSFLVLAKELHFRRAAEKLFMSQSGLSKQIQHLESQLGVVLLERDRRNVRLTKSGSYLMEQAFFLEGYLKQTFNHLRNIADGVEGEIKLGFVGSAMQEVIPQLIKKCNASFSNIHFSLDEMSNQAQIAAIQRYEIDLGFVRLNSAPSDIALQAILQEHFALVIPKGHPIQTHGFKELRQFENAPFILFSSDYSSNYYNNVMSIFTDAGFTPKVSHKSIHANTIFRLVESGLGVAIVPLSLTKGASLAIDIEIIELKDIPQRATLSIAWKKDRHYPALDKLLSFLK